MLTRKKTRNQFLKKALNLYLVLSLLFAQAAPALSLVTPVAASQTQAVSLAQVAYNKDSHSLEVTASGNQGQPVEYVLYYEADEVADAVTGTLSDDKAEIYLGTQSGSDVAAEYPSRVILKLESDSSQVVAAQFSLDYPSFSQVTTVLSLVTYSADTLALSTSESMWLSGGVYRVEPVDLDSRYEFPLNSQVSVTFTQLPQEQASLAMKEIQLTEEQVEELGALSATAYEITSNLENGTFTYDLTLPNPAAAEEVVVQYSEDGEQFEETTAPISSEKVGDQSVVTITGLDHFTVFVVTNPNPTPPPAQYVDIIVDSHDSAGFAETGVWNDSTTACSVDAQNANGRWAYSNQGERKATWEFSVPQTGQYDVSLSWLSHENRSTSARYTITDSTGSTIKTINQNNGSSTCSYSGFVTQGLYQFNAGELYAIVLDEQGSTGLLSADAIRVRSVDEVSEVWVDDDWSLLSIGDGVNGKVFGYNAFSDIQTAMSNVSSGGIIHINKGNYVIPSQINVTKPLSFLGESKSEVILDMSGHVGYGFYVSVSDVAFENFTIYRAPDKNSGYTFHVSGTGNSNQVIENISLDNINVQDAYRTAFDFHAVKHLDLRDLSAFDTRWGNIINLTAVEDANIQGVSGDGNAWGAIAVYASRIIDRASKNIRIDVEYSQLGASPFNAVYSQDDLLAYCSSACPTETLDLENEDISVQNWNYTIFNDLHRFEGPEFTFFAPDEEAARAQAEGLNAFSLNSGSAIFNGIDGQWEVFENLSVQSAINEASDGDTVVIHDGTFTENLLVDKSLTITNGSAPVIDGGNSGDDVIKVTANDV